MADPEFNFDGMSKAVHRNHMKEQTKKLAELRARKLAAGANTTMRDSIATAAMQGLLAGGYHEITYPERTVEKAYKLADEMISYRDKLDATNVKY